MKEQFTLFNLNTDDSFTQQNRDSKITVQVLQNLKPFNQHNESNPTLKEKLLLQFPTTLFHSFNSDLKGKRYLILQLFWTQILPFAEIRLGLDKLGLCKNMCLAI